jgi:hypothetical protein
MPLSPAAEREHLHSRQIGLQGYRRSDGLWDIEGHLTDVKTYGFKNDFRGEIAAGEPIHDMWLRLTIDEDFVVRDVEAVTDGAPFRICPEITPNFKRLIGARMTNGWRREVRERLGGVEGCTHLVETLGAMATAAYQTLYPTLVKKNRAHRNLGKPGIIDSCHAFASDGEVVKKRWPKFYTGSES